MKPVQKKTRTKGEVRLSTPGVSAQAEAKCGCESCGFITSQDLALKLALGLQKHRDSVSAARIGQSCSLYVNDASNAQKRRVSTPVPIKRALRAFNA